VVQEAIGHAEHDPEVRAAVFAALAAARDIVGLDTAELPRLTPREDRATRLTNWSLSGDGDQLRATVRLVDALLAPDGSRGRFARMRLCPFEGLGANALYVSKTLLRWLPAFASTRGGRRAYELPAREPAPASVSEM
jgi:hypothetical protein